MSVKNTDEETGQTPIVIHAPLSGDTERVAALPPSHHAVDIPPLHWELPPGVRDPHAHRAALAARAAQKRVRVFGLDAMRGVCLLAMNLTFALPAVMFLPAWMYHMQNPPPTGDYVALTGLTWQDIIFPGFLFAMAAASPVRGSQLLAAGEPAPRIIWGAAQRSALLYLFSLIIAHVNPYYTHSQTKGGNLLAIAGFLTCFALFVRRRDDWNPSVFKWIRRAGWLAAAIILIVIPPTWGATFSLLRRDGIITSIAFVYFLGTIIWLATGERILIRLLIMLALAVMELVTPYSGAIGALWERSAASWLYEPWYLELLLIAIPGTIAGDLLVRWTGYSEEERTKKDSAAATSRLLAVAGLGLATPLVYVVGLYQHQVMATTIATFVLVALGGLLLTRGQTDRDRLLARMGGWAGVLLVAGILLEPLQGGIKKDPQTISYLLLCGGIWLSVLLALTILIDVVGGRIRRLADPLILAGQNAMFAYVIFMLFLNHIAYYFGFGDFLSANPGEAALRGLLVTSLVMMLLWMATRYRVVWRS